MTDHADKVRATREKITQLDSERDTLEVQVRNRESVRRHIVAQVESAETQAHFGNKQVLGTLTRGRPADILVAHGTAMTIGGPVPVRIDLLPAAVRLLGTTAVKKALLSNLDYLPEGLPPDARTARLAAIAAELDTLQTDEECLIREAAAIGEDIARRPDAAPGYVLARGA